MAKFSYYNIESDDDEEVYYVNNKERKRESKMIHNKGKKKWN